MKLALWIIALALVAQVAWTIHKDMTQADDTDNDAVTYNLSVPKSWKGSV
jgi:hypothetical protein